MKRATRVLLSGIVLRLLDFNEGSVFYGYQHWFSPVIPILIKQDITLKPREPPGL
jgi:hypothetical protein